MLAISESAEAGLAEGVWPDSNLEGPAASPAGVHSYTGAGGARGGTRGEIPAWGRVLPPRCWKAS